MLRALPARPPVPRAKISRLRAQTRVLRGMNSVILCVLGASLGALTVASALPQLRKFHDKQTELEHVLEAERKVIAEKDDARAKLDAMRDDPEFLEIHAIDRLNLHRPGTTVYRIERER